MILTLDPLGRLQLPLDLLDRLQITPGTELELTADHQGFHLRPLPPPPPLEFEQGILVCTSELPASAGDLGRFIDEQRNLRIKEIGGL